MNVPTLLAAEVLGDASPVTLGLAVGLAGVAVLWGETRWQVTFLREQHAKDLAAVREVAAKEKAENDALRIRVTSIEVREGRTLERLDALADRLNRIESKLDKLLERRESA